MRSNIRFHERVELAEWARRNGVHPQTGYRWVREGKMPVPVRRLDSGTIWVQATADAVSSGSTVVYARVSCHDQRADLDRQVARLTQWGTANGHAVSEVVREVGSGLNRARPKLRAVLSDPSARVVVVEHRDRLARYGVEYLEAALATQGRRVLVADHRESTDDLVRDMLDVLTSMCARLYGRRGARSRALRAVSATRQEPGDG